MAFAVLGPIPGTCCNCSAVAEFKSTECAGGGRLVSAQTCTTNNAISKKETAINAQDEIRPAPDLKSSDTISLLVVFRHWAEEGGLVRDLRAVADENDLLVG